MPSSPNNWRNNAIRARFLPSLCIPTVRVESGFGHCGITRHSVHYANKITIERQLPSKMSVISNNYEPGVASARAATCKENACIPSFLISKLVMVRVWSVFFWVAYARFASTRREDGMSLLFFADVGKKDDFNRLFLFLRGTGLPLLVWGSIYYFSNSNFLKRKAFHNWTYLKEWKWKGRK